MKSSTCQKWQSTAFVCYLVVPEFVKPQMPNFRWPLLYHDIALTKEVISSRLEKPSDWGNIATKLSVIFSSEEKPVMIKGRACRERLDLLLKKYREDAKALRRSGTEEEYSELHQLLEDISSYLRDFNTIWAAQAAERAAQLKKAEEDKCKGEEMRHAAMEGISKRKQSEVNPAGPSSRDMSATPSIESSAEGSLDDDYEEEEEEEDMESITTPYQKKRKTGKEKGVAKVPATAKRSSRLTAMEAFERRHKERSALRERELLLKEKELELQKQKMEFEREATRKKREVEEAERKQRMEIELEEKGISGVAKKALEQLISGDSVVCILHIYNLYDAIDLW